MRFGKVVKKNAIILPKKRALNRPLPQTAPVNKKKRIEGQIEQTRPLTPPPNFDILNSQESLGSMWSPSIFERQQQCISFSQVSLPTSPTVPQSQTVRRAAEGASVDCVLTSIRTAVEQVNEVIKEQLLPLLDKTLCFRGEIMMREMRRAMNQMCRIESGTQAHNSQRRKKLQKYMNTKLQMHVSH